MLKSKSTKIVPISNKNVPNKIGQLLAVLGSKVQASQKVAIFTPKGTSLREFTSIKPFCVKIG